MTLVPPPGRLAVVVGGAAAPVAAALVRHTVSHVLRHEGADAHVAVTFLGKDAMRRLNQRHLDHDWPTDVISFALPQPDGAVTGDIYICRYMAAREARRRGLAVREELVRLMVHGTLHVIGHVHDEGEARTRSPMWTLQEHYVRELS
ncbi:MAG: rRNA maturation RNase YbeY [Gemmatimonadales bacterium]|nr:rRNA maturation RNase YbeY [Gemmatimonadales bacterium]